MIEIILGAVFATICHFAIKTIDGENDLSVIICFIMLFICLAIAVSILVIATNDLIKYLL